MQQRLALIQTLGFVALYVIACVGLFGFGFFTLNPENLSVYPSAATIYGSTFAFFAQAQIYLAAATFALILQRGLRSRWWFGAALVLTVGFVSEYFGTTRGIPFGNYEYTALLGEKIAGRVPPGIALSWFFMGACTYLLMADRGQSTFVMRILGGALLLTSWDLVLDPAMSRLTQYWVWEEGGAYYGTPIANFGGWILTGIVVGICLEIAGAKTWALSVPRGPLLLFFGANALLPLGMCALAGYWQAVGYFLLATTLLGGILIVARGLRAGVIHATRSPVGTSSR
jgi:putative membrane protein